MLTSVGNCHRYHGMFCWNFAFCVISFEVACSSFFKEFPNFPSDDSMSRSDGNYGTFQWKFLINTVLCGSTNTANGKRRKKHSNTRNMSKKLGLRQPISFVFRQNSGCDPKVMARNSVLRLCCIFHIYITSYLFYNLTM